MGSELVTTCTGEEVLSGVAAPSPDQEEVEEIMPAKEGVATEGRRINIKLIPCSVGDKNRE